MFSYVSRFGFCYDIVLVLVIFVSPCVSWSCYWEALGVAMASLRDFAGSLSGPLKFLGVQGESFKVHECQTRNVDGGF